MIQRENLWLLNCKDYFNETIEDEHGGYLSWRHCYKAFGENRNKTEEIRGSQKMKVIEYFSTDNKEYWLSKIKESDWNAGKRLYELLKNKKLKDLVGENTKVLMLVDEGELISYCTFADKDDIQPTELTPWIGWVYTFPQYRGHRYFGKLFDYAEELAKSDGIKNIYISTNHTGLYEKYGYEFLGILKDIDGEDSRVYVRYL